MGDALAAMVAFSCGPVVLGEIKVMFDGFWVIDALNMVIFVCGPVVLSEVGQCSSSSP